MLIPGNIPNIIAAGKLNITSKEWATFWCSGWSSYNGGIFCNFICDLLKWNINLSILNSFSKKDHSVSVFFYRRETPFLLENRDILPNIHMRCQVTLVT